MNNFYVYEYIRLDTNEPFYIGKGHGNRWKQLNKDRNNYFKNIVNKVSVAVVILKDNLTSDEALNVESWYIWKLRDRLGYNLVNFTDGGDGIAGYHHTEKSRKLIGEKSKKYWLTQPKKPNNRKNRSECKYKIVAIEKDSKIIEEFKCVKDLCNYIKQNFPKPNGINTVISKLKNNEELNGYKLIYK